jgi:hypothetical protein
MPNGGFRRNAAGWPMSAIMGSIGRFRIALPDTKMRTNHRRAEIGPRNA